MAGDWIKMRVGLPGDPRVIAMADYLAWKRTFMSWLCDPVHVMCKKSAYEYVTRDVTVSLCVMGLLRVWGMGNDIGEVSGMDVILPSASLHGLDATAGIPSFGDAMAVVGWAVENGDDTVTLVNFKRWNTTGNERKSQGAERQKAYRDRQKTAAQAGKGDKNVTSRVTSLVTRDKSREEKIRAATPEQTAAADDFSSAGEADAEILAVLGRLEIREPAASRIAAVPSMTTDRVIREYLGIQGKPINPAGVLVSRLASGTSSPVAKITPKRLADAVRAGVIQTVNGTSMAGRVTQNTQGVYVNEILAVKAADIETVRLG